MRTQTDIFQNELWAIGNRQTRYFGVDLFLSKTLFDVTRSTIFGSSRCDSRIKCFRRKEQEAMRDDLASIGGRLGIHIQDIKDEWQMLCKNATAVATKAWKYNYGKTPNDYIENTSQNIKRLTDCYLAGKVYIRGQIEIRREGIYKWRNYHTGDVLFDISADDSRPVTIYVKMQKIHSQETHGKKIYKIGKTTRNKNRRDKEHKTSNTDLLDITDFSESGVLNETNIKKFFKDCLLDGQREWFALTSKQVDLLKSPVKLKKKILGFLNEKQ